MLDLKNLSQEINSKIQEITDRQSLESLKTLDFIIFPLIFSSSFTMIVASAYAHPNWFKFNDLSSFKVSELNGRFEWSKIISLFIELVRNIVLILAKFLSMPEIFFIKKGTNADVHPLQIITFGNQNKLGNILIAAKE